MGGGDLMGNLPPKRKIPYYRARLSCKVGKDAIDRGACPEGRVPLEYAIYNLLCAIEDIAEGLEKE